MARHCAVIFGNPVAVASIIVNVPKSIGAPVPRGSCSTCNVQVAANEDMSKCPLCSSDLTLRNSKA